MKISWESVETLFASKSGLKVTFSEIAFWCAFDQKISKTFQYFKVWIKSGLKVTFSA